MSTTARLFLLAACGASLAAHPGHGPEGHLAMHGLEVLALSAVAVIGLVVLWRRGRSQRG